MLGKDSRKSRAFGARGIIVFGAVLGPGLSARPAAAQQPYLYVANNGSNNVSVIDTATNTVVGTPIPVGNGPQGTAVTPGGTPAIVANQLSKTVSVIDMIASPPSVATVTLAGGSNPSRVAITPNGLYAYVANNGSNTVSVITTATNAVAATVTVGSFPFAVAITPNGQLAYVTNDGSQAVSVIDTATNTPLTGPGYPITVGASPLGIAITPSGQYAYVANGSSNTVSVIDTTTNPPNVIATIPAGSSPSGVAINPDGAHVYVTNQTSNTVSVIDTATNTPLTGPGYPIAVGLHPDGVAVTPDGTRVYVANRNSNTVSVIDTTNNPPNVTATVTVGNSPSDVAFGPPPPPVSGLGIHVNSCFLWTGESYTGTITLSEPAPFGGTTVTLSSSGPADLPPDFTVPASVLVNAGSTWASFPITVSATPSAGTVAYTAGGAFPIYITGTEPDGTVWQSYPLLKVGVGQIALSSAYDLVLLAGETAYAEVAVRTPAGGLITLGTNYPWEISVPANVALPGSGRCATFPFRALPGPASVIAAVTAHYEGNGAEWSFSVNERSPQPG
jgi:YVTN family beta-propeller protein